MEALERACKCHFLCGEGSLKANVLSVPGKLEKSPYSACTEQEQHNAAYEKGVAHDLPEGACFVAS